MRPYVIGLTGPIGCGKSNVMRTLEQLGAEGIDADRVAHDVILPGATAFNGVVASFGKALVGPDGRIDRRRLGDIVFADPAALARLEAVVHPAVSEVIRQRVLASRAPVVVIEAIKLIEASLSVDLCDEVWVAVCSESEQFARLAASRGMRPDDVRKRSANQMSASEMIRHADRVINTDGSLEETAGQVRDAWVQLGFRLPA